MDIKHLEELAKGYEWNKSYGVIKSPGKFEGETLATLYYYDAFLNGDGVVFEVTDDEREALDIDSHVIAFYLHESDNGFVSLLGFGSLKQAENMEYLSDGSREDY